MDDAPEKDNFIIGKKLPVQLVSQATVADCDGIDVKYDPVALTSTLTWTNMPPGSVIVFQSAADEAIEEHITGLEKLVAEMSNMGECARPGRRRARCL